MDNCEHLVKKLVRIDTSNGLVQYKWQCQRCGETGSAIKHDALTEQQKRQAAPVDRSIRERWWEERREQWKALHEEQDRLWWKRYFTYLNSSEWRERRSAVLKRDEGLCQARLSGCETYAVHVHHKTYDHLGDEPLWELESVCLSCHNKITQMDRARRGPAARQTNQSQPITL